MKNRTYTRKKELKKYKTNPFINNRKSLKTVNKSTAVSTDTAYTLDPKSGEILEQSRLVFSKKIDAEIFVKIFEAGLDKALNLSPSALRLFIYLIKILIRTNTIKCSPDTMYLKWSAIKADYGYRYTNGTFISARNELCVQKILAPVEDNSFVFFFDIDSFFKGSRTSLL